MLPFPRDPLSRPIVVIALPYAGVAHLVVGLNPHPYGEVRLQQITDRPASLDDEHLAARYGGRGNLPAEPVIGEPRDGTRERT